MASRTAKIASSIVAGILAGAPLIMPRDVANAAECLTEPGKDGTAGQHWYYRIEHGSKRHCWYLRGDDGKAVQTAPADDSEPATQATSQSSDNPPRSPEDARAEFPMPQARGNTVAAPAPSQAPLVASPAPALPQANGQGSAVASRWPSPETAIAPAASAPTAPTPTLAAAPPATADASDSAPAADAASDTSANTTAPAPAAVVPPAPPAKPSVSLQMLFAVIGGALALAGLTASVVYRLGRRKERRLDTKERRAVLWESVESGPRPPWVPPEIEETEPLPFPERRPVQYAKPAQDAKPTQDAKPAQNTRSQQRHEKIEELLEQLVRQAQQSDA
jgi:hypothetical protein